MSKILKSLVNSFKIEFTYYNHDKYKPCVVFDIDGTLIIEGIYKPKNKNEVIQDIYKFEKYLENNNIPIFIITARPESKVNRQGTVDMLRMLGIKYKYLYMLDMDLFNSTKKYKEEARKEIFDNNYNILMSLGDNTWDYGDYGGLGVHIHEDGKEIEYIRDFL